MVCIHEYPIDTCYYPILIKLTYVCFCSGYINFKNHLIFYPKRKKSLNFESNTMDIFIFTCIMTFLHFIKFSQPAYVSYANRLTSTSIANVSSQDVIKQNDTQQMEVAKMVYKNADSSGKRNQSVTSDKVESKSILLTDRQQREANLGTILVGISLLFICCQSIKIIPDVSIKTYIPVSIFNAFFSAFKYVI